MHGIFLVDKPAGITSAEVVRRVKAKVRPARVGHLGTLDPFATGVLPILIGEGTKLAPYLEGGDKEYEGVVKLGVETDTLDPEGQPVRDEQLKPATDRVNVALSDVFEKRNMLYVRYEIHNDTRGAYFPGTPKVLLLSGVRASESLVGRENTQLSDREAARLKVQARTPLQVVDEKVRSAKLAPGKETLGVVGVKLPSFPQAPQVLRIEFAGDGKGTVTATLVL